jgi:hypothetical protein
MDYLERAYHEPWDFNPSVSTPTFPTEDTRPTGARSATECGPKAAVGAGGRSSGFVANNPELVAVVLGAAAVYVSCKITDALFRYSLKRAERRRLARLEGEAA